MKKGLSKTQTKTNNLLLRQGNWGQLEIEQEGQRERAECLKTDQNERQGEPGGS